MKMLKLEQMLNVFEKNGIDIHEMISYGIGGKRYDDTHEFVCKMLSEYADENDMASVNGINDIIGHWMLDGTMSERAFCCYNDIINTIRNEHMHHIYMDMHDTCPELDSWIMEKRMWILDDGRECRAEKIYDVFCTATKRTESFDCVMMMEIEYIDINGTYRHKFEQILDYNKMVELMKNGNNVSRETLPVDENVELTEKMAEKLLEMAWETSENVAEKILYSFSEMLTAGKMSDSVFAAAWKKRDELADEKKRRKYVDMVIDREQVSEYIRRNLCLLNNSGKIRFMELNGVNVWVEKTVSGNPRMMCKTDGRDARGLHYVYETALDYDGMKKMMGVE